ncbi:hypothetical protein [Flagellimonas myxillae]|uniref:hypothetical protein n=1 Tax=Flagellimonas myxillae TaxID=2942214 RepID=UPI00201F4CE2|nr:hypothetical protein [Muricauda myxillae]MCL6265221.1 hypothetical protein [Muricauda myxillae]
MKKQFIPFMALTLLLLSYEGHCQNPPENSLNCAEYWASVRINDFCGLAAGQFEFNTLPVDICNADQKEGVYRFDDTVSIRVYNHFTEEAALEEYNAEEADALSVATYEPADDLGDDAFGLIQVEFGELDLVIIQVVKGTFTLYLEINGKAQNGANNCFDKISAYEFARALVEPL